MTPYFGQVAFEVAYTYTYFTDLPCWLNNYFYFISCVSIYMTQITSFFETVEAHIITNVKRGQSL